MTTKTKLCQIIAIVKGQKTRTTEVLTSIYHKLQKAELFNGIIKTYSPKDEDGDKLPPESKRVIYSVGESLAEACPELVRLLDLIATQDEANCHARASVVSDGQEILGNVPVTYLMFLEKQLIDLRTFISKMPTLDPADAWTFDKDVNAFTTSQAVTTRTKKISKVLVKYEATAQHPAQTEMVSEDVIAGYWSTTKLSGAIPESKKRLWSSRLDRLISAVKSAREQANTLEVTDVLVGTKVVNFVFAD